MVQRLLQDLVKKILIKLVKVEVHTQSSEGVHVSSTENVAKQIIVVEVVILEVEDLCYHTLSNVRLDSSRLSSSQQLSK
jgi:hypothetical protein